MPHIHTEPGQHDITTSAWIFKEDQYKNLRMLLHLHRKHGKLMQVGGHVELNETPWQALAHEVLEEAGFTLDELQVLQPVQKIPVITKTSVHPVPAVVNTHLVGDDHYHSDYGYVFMAERDPVSQPAEGESKDLRWLTIDELHQAYLDGITLKDIAEIAEYIVDNVIPIYYKMRASSYDQGKPGA